MKAAKSTDRVERVASIAPSPLNGKRWLITLECGCEEWVTRSRRPKLKLAMCREPKHGEGK